MSFEELCSMKSGSINENYYRIQVLQKLKQKERKNMKKTTKRISGITAAVAVAVLLVGGTVSAAVIYNNSIHLRMARQL